MGAFASGARDTSVGVSLGAAHIYWFSYQSHNIDNAWIFKKNIHVECPVGRHEPHYFVEINLLTF